LEHKGIRWACARLQEEALAANQPRGDGVKDTNPAGNGICTIVPVFPFGAFGVHTNPWF
jgi:hypothetical protein